jgi:hypothetical protein
VWEAVVWEVIYAGLDMGGCLKTCNPGGRADGNRKQRGFRALTF